MNEIVEELKHGIMICDTTGTSLVHVKRTNAENIITILMEQKQPEWISVKDRMPEEHGTIFAKLKGTDKWRSAMFEKSSDDVRIVEVFEDGTRRVYHSHTIDGKWDIEKQPIKRTVTHWMPNPELPKDDAE